MCLFVNVLTSQIEIELNPIATQLNDPVGIEFTKDGKLYFILKRGQVVIFEDGQLQTNPFIDIDDRVHNGGGERGLLGMAFHPSYPDSPYVYINYTPNDGNTHISRFELDENNPNQLDPNSEKVLLFVDQPFGNHNGGDLNFNQEGLLFIGLGDGGSGGDPRDFSQNPNSLLGKMLRIDVDNGDPYAIPSDNPFVNNDEVLDEIWSLGLRNPWRFSFDRLTDELYMADVGQSAREEISYEVADCPGGLNFGWRCYEGNEPFNTSDCDDESSYEPPIYEYGHNLGCSITGGHVYRGSTYPWLQGKYIYTDYCSGRFWALYRDENDTWQNIEIGRFNNWNFSSFGEDKDGELYVASDGRSTVYKLAFSCNVSPPPFSLPGPVEVCDGDNIFSLDGGEVPSGFIHQWLLNDEVIPGANDRF
ncbi:MAG: PQQ-dependent sugar dehydrogenase, partial [Bacteroidota bacterium]